MKFQQRVTVESHFFQFTPDWKKNRDSTLLLKSIVEIRTHDYTKPGASYMRLVDSLCVPSAYKARRKLWAAAWSWHTDRHSETINRIAVFSED